MVEKAKPVYKELDRKESSLISPRLKQEKTTKLDFAHGIF